MAFEPSEVRSALKKLAKVDPILGDLIRRVGPFTLTVESGGYKILVRSMLSQQISLAAARTIRGRLQDLLPGRKIKSASIAALTDDQLQSAGVSKQKRGYLRDLTRCALDGTINFRRISGKSDDDAIAELIKVKGIGRWTAQMYLLFSLGRPDVFAPDDLGLQNAVKSLYSLPEKPKRAELEAISAPWSPYRSIASWYLWRAIDQKVITTEYPV